MSSGQAAPTEGITASLDREEKRRAALQTSVKEGAAYSAMVGFGNNYVVPFALWLGAGAQQIGLLASLPVLVGALIQAAAVGFSERVESRLKFIIPLTLLQAILWLPIILAPFLFPDGPVPWIILFFSVNALAGALINPPWMSMMADLVSQGERGAYFSKRNKVTEFVVLSSTFAAGYVLGVFQGRSEALLGFAAIFAMAIIGRLCSTYFFTRSYEVPAEKPVPDADSITLWRFVKKEFFSSESKFGTLALYACLFSFAVEFSSPFFLVYMLKDLGFDYYLYGAIIVAFNLALLLTYSYWGKLIDGYGNKLVLYVTALMIPLVPLGFALFTHPALLFSVEILSGIAWAGQRLSSFNLVLEASPREHRQRYVAYYNLFNGLGAFAGATAGGFIAVFLAETGAKLFIFQGLGVIFVLSAAMRLAVAVAFIPKIHGIAFNEKIADRYFLFRTVTIYPLRSMMGELQGGISGGISLGLRGVHGASGVKNRALDHYQHAKHAVLGIAHKTRHATGLAREKLAAAFRKK